MFTLKKHDETVKKKETNKQTKKQRKGKKEKVPDCIKNYACCQFLTLIKCYCNKAFIRKLYTLRSYTCV